MPDYSGPRLGPDDRLERCKCGLSRSYHEPDEAYYDEYRLEGRRSSSYALRRNGCSEYDEAGLTLSDLLRLRYCCTRWLRCKRGE